MNKKLMVVLVAFVLLLVLKLYSSSETHFPFYPYIDTIFAKDFSWEKFNRVEVGMTQEQVEKRLGEPLYKDNYGNSDPDFVCWKYSKDGKLRPYADFSYYSIQVCFDNGLVYTKNVNEFGD